MAVFNFYHDGDHLKVQTPIKSSRWWGDHFVIRVSSSNPDRKETEALITPRQALELAKAIFEELGQYEYFDRELI